MNRILANMPYQILLEMFENSGDNVSLLQTLIDELSQRPDSASLRLCLSAQNKIQSLTKTTEVISNHKSNSPSSSDGEKVKHPDLFQTECCSECKTPFNKSKFNNDLQFSYCENPNCNRIYVLAKTAKSEIHGYFYENPNKDGIVSIDFGTSSIRASIASHDGQDMRPLKIGAALGAREDFYLESNIFITNDQDPKVFLSMWGEVEKKKHKNNQLLYTLSPKSWLTSSDYAHISTPVLHPHSVNREDLLALLLSLAIKGILTDANLTLAELNNYEIRVSHPVWEQDLWADKKLSLEKIIEKSFIFSSTIEQGITFSQVDKILKNTKMDYSLRTSIDVVEPVAAAIELFRNKPGYRQICAIIDIGAGTTDLGLFGIITPDSSSYLNRDGVSIKKIFKSLAHPVSIQMAGDYIDETLTLIYQSKLGNYYPKNLLTTFREEIRERKVELFDDLELYFDDIKITLSELKNHPRIDSMTNQIKDKFIGMLESSKEEISKQYNLNVNYIRSIDVVFAGGGNKIDFIRQSIPSKLLLQNQAIDIVIQDIDPPFNLRNIDHARLSVSLGGTCHESNWPATNPKVQTYGFLDEKFNKSPIT